MRSRYSFLSWCFGCWQRPLNYYQCPWERTTDWKFVAIDNYADVVICNWYEHYSPIGVRAIKAFRRLHFFNVAKSCYLAVAVKVPSAVYWTVRFPMKWGFAAYAPVVISAGVIRTSAAVIAVANTVTFLMLSGIFPRLLVTTNIITRFETLISTRYLESEAGLIYQLNEPLTRVLHRH